jgi:GT2 family glycosyltransferase
MNKRIYINNKKMVAVLILNWNGVKDTLRCIEKVADQKENNISIYVLDNGSENNEAKIITNKYGRIVQVYRAKTNLGYTGGSNFLINKASITKPDYFLLLNNDTLIGDNFFQSLIQVMNENSNIGLLNPLIYSSRKKNEIEVSGGRLSWINAKIKIYRDKPKILRLSSFATGCALMVRPVIINNGKLFDDRFFAYFEDAALSLTASSSGYDVAITPKTFVYHKGAASSGNESSFKTYLMSRNRILFVKYYLPKYYILYFAVISTLKLILSFIYFRLIRQGHRISAFRKGYVDGWLSRTGEPNL